MGNQLHSAEGVIRPAEILLAGALGPVREAHSWSDKAFAPGDRPKEEPPVPPHLHWDLWLGPAPERPYHSKYHPFNWRGWWDFGGGNLADMACHILDPVFWGLKLGAPLTAEAEGPPPHPESSPASRVVRWEFPARGDLPPVKYSWYDGGKRPAAELLEGVKLPGQGSIVIGERGKMLLTHGGGYKIFGDLEEPPKTLPRPSGHHAEWIRAIKEGTPTGSNFAYAAALTETVLLGNVAYRAQAKIAWQGEVPKAKGCPEADRYIHKEYRKGWAL
jgi:predicted dehydrogenase